MDIELDSFKNELVRLEKEIDSLKEQLAKVKAEKEELQIYADERDEIIDGYRAAAEDILRAIRRVE